MHINSATEHVYVCVLVCPSYVGVHTYLCVCTCICITHVYAHMYICMISVCLSVHVCTCVRAYTYVDAWCVRMAYNGRRHSTNAIVLFKPSSVSCNSIKSTVLVIRVEICLDSSFPQMNAPTFH